jgi:NADP-dependent 3-hydroxy acid dehydrogenase YdfG
LHLLEAVAAKARGLGVEATCLNADLADDGELGDLVQRLVKLPSLDILVHCAGLVQRASIDQASLEDFDGLYRINVRAPYALTKSLLPTLKACRGDIVFINSSGGIAAKELYAQYDSSKHALRAVADSLRAEVNRDGVRVLSVFIGNTASDMQAKLHEEAGKPYQPHLLTQPEDVASVVVNILLQPRTMEVTDIRIRPAIKS